MPHHPDAVGATAMGRHHLGSALEAYGLPVTLNWDGSSDMVTAIDAMGPGWSVSRSGLRDAKEALRTRLYAPGERARRDRVLAALAAQFSAWRATRRSP